MKNHLLHMLGLFLILGCDPQEKTPIHQPNIVWLVAEDQSPEFFPMYGNPTATLPNLYGLATDGVVFSNAYTPAPVCAPARSALITGMYPTSMGTHNMRTYNAYQPDNQPEIGIPSYSPMVPGNVRMFTEYLRKKGYYCSNNSKEDYNFNPTDGAWDDSSPTAHWKNRPDNTPFFAVFNFGITHESQIWRQAEEPLTVSPNEVPVPPVFPDNEIIRKDLAINYSNLERMDRQIGQRLEELKAAGLYENTIIFFYGDHGGPFPRYKRAVYETGIKVPLVIKFEGKQNAGTTNDALISFIDYAPTVLSLAGIQPPVVMQGRALFGPFKNKTKNKFVFAASDRFDGMTDRLRAVRYSKYKYIRNFKPEISNAFRVKYREQMAMMQNLNRLWKSDSLSPSVVRWFQTPKPEEELYDIETDPYELNNLAENVALKDTLLFLRNTLNDWMEKTKDLGAIPEKELIQQWLPKPRLEPLLIEADDNKIILKPKRIDATVVYKFPLDSTWSIYTRSLPKTQSFKAKAVRIGFEESPLYQNKPF